MSHDFRPERNIFACDLFDGRLAKFGVHEGPPPNENQVRTLVDGQGHGLGVWIDDDGDVSDFVARRWDRNTDAILAAVAEAFETEIFSEHEPQYWGCETHEEFLETYFPKAAKTEIELKAEAQRGHRQVGKTGMP